MSRSICTHKLSQPGSICVRFLTHTLKFAACAGYANHRHRSRDDVRCDDWQAMGQRLLLRLRELRGRRVFGWPWIHGGHFFGRSTLAREHRVCRARLHIGHPRGSESHERQHMRWVHARNVRKLLRPLGWCRSRERHVLWRRQRECCKRAEQTLAARLREPHAERASRRLHAERGR